VNVLADTMGGVFPELRARQNHVRAVIRVEEEAFNRTLDRWKGCLMKNIFNIFLPNKVISRKNFLKLFLYLIRISRVHIENACDVYPCIEFNVIRRIHFYDIPVK
jgi:hypothetical protein